MLEVEIKNKKLQTKLSLLQETNRANKLEKLLITVLGIKKQMIIDECNSKKYQYKTEKDKQIKAIFENVLGRIQYDVENRDLVIDDQIRTFIDKMLK